MPGWQIAAIAVAAALAAAAAAVFLDRAWSHRHPPAPRDARPPHGGTGRARTIGGPGRLVPARMHRPGPEPGVAEEVDSDGDSADNGGLTANKTRVVLVSPVTMK